MRFRVAKRVFRDAYSRGSVRRWKVRTLVQSDLVLTRAGFHDGVRSRSVRCGAAVLKLLTQGLAPMTEEAFEQWIRDLEGS